MKNGDKPTQLELAKALGISWTQLKVLLSKGMPPDIEGAKKWRADHIQTPHNGEVSLQPVQMPRTTGETLEDTIDRLRRLEAGLSRALGQAFHNGQAQRSAALRREYLQALVALANAEGKLMKLQQDRLELIHTSRALKMVDGSLQAGLTALRRLPDFCQDPGDRVRVEAGVNVVLEEFRRGAQEAAAPYRS